MKRLFFILLLIIYFLPACTQSRKIKNFYGYSQHQTFGTIATDEKGNQLTPGAQTNHYIYLELVGNIKPKILEIYYNGHRIKNFSISATGDRNVNVGIVNSLNRNIVLTPAKGNVFWKIEFTFKENNTSDNGVVEMEQVKADVPVKIIIKGKEGSRSFTLKINKEVILQPIMGV